MEELLFISLVLLLGLGIILARTNQKFEKIREDFQNPYFSLAFGAVIILAVWGMDHRQSKKVQEATKFSLFAFTVAYLTHHEMYYPVFVLTWFFVYYTF